MGKTPKPKPSARTQSKHSRASRRAVSPSVDIDKSLTSLPRPDSPNPNADSSVLSTQHGAGISKKKPKSKRLTRAQRLRQEKGLERAEIVMDKTEKKVSVSTMRGKKVNARKAAWDELNIKIGNQNGNTQTMEEEKIHVEPLKEDITLATPDEPTKVEPTFGFTVQNTVSNADLDLAEDEEIT
ncbi:hypothetical protein FQN54_006895 [Arachnomyces sp. PD_36]|nr:hypothetical protein FQN54_006895 [Arachnomyces sp. PD_36]